MDSVQCSLTSCVVNNSVDLLVFNPPYVPSANSEIPTINGQSNIDQDSGAWLDMALNGGDDGMIVTAKLLDNLHDILADNGVAYILFCARNKPDDVYKQMKERKLQVEKVIFRKCGWEELSVLRLWKRK
ncbi:uncharacterized protein ASCRUDRAFT_76804 [Ascoidea rubescens DSM 1968]|nr:hypothetical protein ASCRUDRAFT_76804 [Ascoidea rubescens DSM 1968]ODV59858.1 hypothetical protein ASCRUDRAFT_76804 [Ascoidea rubescens DSM 1968]